MGRKRIVRGFVVASILRFAALGFSALGFAAAPAAVAQEAPAWRHGVLEAKSDAGIIMMVRRGFAERQGLKLELVPFKSDVIEMQALLSGEIDSFDGGAYLTIVAAARGADVKVIGCPWPGMPYAIFVRGSIASVGDLKGRTFAISAPGASPDLVARAVLAQGGIPAAAVHFANLGGDADRFRALAAGVADAAVVTIEYVPVAEAQGLKVLVMGRDVLPMSLRFCMHATGKTLATRPEPAARFLAAEITAWRYALAHRDEALALTREITGAKADDPRPGYFFDDAVRSHSVDPNMAIPVDKFTWAAGQLLADGTLARPFDVRRMIDPEPRARAIERAGK